MSPRKRRLIAECSERVARFAGSTLLALPYPQECSQDSRTCGLYQVARFAGYRRARVAETQTPKLATAKARGTACSQYNVCAGASVAGLS